MVGKLILGAVLLVRRRWPKRIASAERAPGFCPGLSRLIRRRDAGGSVVKPGFHYALLE